MEHLHLPHLHRDPVTRRPSAAASAGLWPWVLGLAILGSWFGSGCGHTSAVTREPDSLADSYMPRMECDTSCEPLFRWPGGKCPTAANLAAARERCDKKKDGSACLRVGTGEYHRKGLRLLGENCEAKDASACARLGSWYGAVGRFKEAVKALARGCALGSVKACHEVATPAYDHKGGPRWGDLCQKGYGPSCLSEAQWRALPRGHDKASWTTPAR